MQAKNDADKRFRASDKEGEVHWREISQLAIVEISVRSCLRFEGYTLGDILDGDNKYYALHIHFDE